MSEDSMRRFVFISLFGCFSLWAGADGYFQAFPELKKSEDWAGIVRLGQEALSEPISPQEAMKIHSQLASTFFYLGDFSQTEIHSSLCLSIARDEIDLDQEVQALYLLSASARALEAYDSARNYAKLALEKVKDGPLRAKVLFNLGAAYADDPKGNLKAAESAYEEAFRLFSCPEDRARTAIRLGKVYLLQGEIEKASDQVLTSLSSIESERVKLQAEYLMAQIEKAKGSIEEARIFAENALKRAKILMARKDCERISAFLESL